jgi:hypothetical protein
MQGLEPSEYVLTGDGPLRVIYVRTGLDGQPNLTYQDTHRTLMFSGGEIFEYRSDMGALISVTIGKAEDIGSTSFSLLIPRVALPDGQPANIRTIGITTVHQSTIDAPARGQLDTYRLHDLSGTASIIEA